VTPFTALKNHGSGTKDEHTGISSVEEEYSASALIAGKTKAADIQEEKGSKDAVTLASVLSSGGK
jgi:hypothetical protein